MCGGGGGAMTDKALGGGMRLAGIVGWSGRAGFGLAWRKKGSRSWDGAGLNGWLGGRVGALFRLAWRKKRC